MKLLALIATLALTGCAKPPEWLAEMHDRNDTCQRVELIRTGQYPSWCGAGGRRTAIYNTNNQRVGYIKQ